MGRLILILSMAAMTANAGCSDEHDSAGPTDAGPDSSTDDDGNGDEGPDEIGPGNAGAACDSSEECEAPAGGNCLQSIDPVAPFRQALALAGPLLASMVDASVPAVEVPEVDLTVETPGGYCSASCQEDAECGTGSVCFSLQALIGPLLDAFGMGMGGPTDGGAAANPLGGIGGLLGGDGLCLAPCSQDSDCREDEDYVCRGPFDDLTVEGLPDAAAPMPGAPDLTTILAGAAQYCLPPQTDAVIEVITPDADAGMYDTSSRLHG